MQGNNQNGNTEQPGNPWYMPGSGMGESGGTTGATSGNAGTPEPGSGISGGSSPGATGSGGSIGNHFEASFESDGSVSIILPGSTGITNGNPSSAIELGLSKYKTIGTAIVAICIITAIICLLVQITKLGVAGDSERLRASALKGIIYSGAAIAAFGALTLVVSMFWNALA